MAFNLLIGSNFNTLDRWKFINCEYKDGYIISNKKLFGIEQELILPDITKLYFRIKYFTDSNKIETITIGIQNGKLLEVNKKNVISNKEALISTVVQAKQEKIKAHIIFESKEEINKVKIIEPLLLNLNSLHKSTWLKWVLDKTVGYLKGYEYKNEYSASEINNSINDFKDVKLEKAKIGSIISTLQNISININAKLLEDHFYLIKLDYKNINDLGKIYFQYGVSKSLNWNDEQIYLVFKANKTLDLKLNIENKEVLPYQINLKHILLVDMTYLNLMQEDIGYLPFI